MQVKDSNGKPFKDNTNINKPGTKEYAKLVAELTSALNSRECLEKLLLPNEIEAYNGAHRIGKHKKCATVKRTDQKKSNGPIQFNEKRICRCLYHSNSVFSKNSNCEACEFKNRRRGVIGAYTIIDHEFPVSNRGKKTRVGNIDLMITETVNVGTEADIQTLDASMIYATEIKPPQDELDSKDKGNRETLLRMIAEILTYTCAPGVLNYKKAIAFFEGTAQEMEYLKKEEDIQNLLVAAQIAVFFFKKTSDGKAYEICRLQ